MSDGVRAFVSGHPLGFPRPLEPVIVYEQVAVCCGVTISCFAMNSYRSEKQCHTFSVLPHDSRIKRLTQIQRERATLSGSVWLCTNSVGFPLKRPDALMSGLRPIGSLSLLKKVQSVASVRYYHFHRKLRSDVIYFSAQSLLLKRRNSGQSAHTAIPTFEIEIAKSILRTDKQSNK